MSSGSRGKLQDMQRQPLRGVGQAERDSRDDDRKYDPKGELAKEPKTEKIRSPEIE